MADSNECNSPKTILQQHLDSRTESLELAEHNAFADRRRFILNSQSKSKSTGEFGRSGAFKNQPLTLEKSKPLAFQKVITWSCVKGQIHRSTKHNQSSSTSSTSSKLPVKMKRSQPTETVLQKKMKTWHPLVRWNFGIKTSANNTVIYDQAGAIATLFVPTQDSQGMDEQVVYPEGSSADRSGYPEYTTLWIPD